MKRARLGTVGACVLCLVLVQAAPACDPDEGCADVDCNDDDPCTADSCLEDNDGRVFCAHEPVANCGGSCESDADCDDQDMCTSDACNGGTCIRSPLSTPGCEKTCAVAADCDDMNECTGDECDGNVCLHLAIPGCSEQCVDDGMCDGGETCDCADCAVLETCGAGCMAFTIVDAPSASFLDATPSNLGGPEADYFQGFGLTMTGMYTLSPPANLVTDCMGPTPCIQLNVDGMDFFAATSGTLDLTSTSPIEAVFRDVVFHPSTTDMNNDVTVDLDGPCLYLKEGIIPTP